MDTVRIKAVPKGKKDGRRLPRGRIRWLALLASRLILSCGIVFLLLWGMFLLAKGPAYIFFEEETEKSDLSGLYSQAIHLRAETAAADLAGSGCISTVIRGSTIALSSTALTDWMEETSVGAPHATCCLLLERTTPWELEMTHCAQEATARYMIHGGYDTYIDPCASQNISSGFSQLQVYPQVLTGGSYESGTIDAAYMTFTVTQGQDVKVYIMYSDDEGRELREPVDKELLPGYSASGTGSWTFTLPDYLLQIGSPEEEPLQLGVAGRYKLKLSCVGVEQVRGYMTGQLLFQNTNTPKTYPLAGQLVDIRSKDSGLRVILSRDMQYGEQGELLVNGEATQMDISGINPFPDLRMWFRENIYMAPVSLLSVMISMVGLTLSQKKHKTKVRKKT